MTNFTSTYTITHYVMPQTFNVLSTRLRTKKMMKTNYVIRRH